MQGIFSYREMLSFQYCQNDKEGASYKGQILWASTADLTPEEQAEIGEGLSHGECGSHRQRNGDLEECGHRACYETVNGHGKGKEDGLLPGQAVTLVGICLHRIAVNINDET